MLKLEKPCFRPRSCFGQGYPALVPSQILLPFDGPQWIWMGNEATSFKAENPSPIILLGKSAQRKISLKETDEDWPPDQNNDDSSLH